MDFRTSLKLIALLSYAPFSLASYSFPAVTAGAVYPNFGTEWIPFCFDNAAECFDSCSDMWSGSPQAASMTYTFPAVSTSFQWWGYQWPSAGQAQVCFDGATSGSGCHTVSYANPSTEPGLSPAVELFSITGLTNEIHTVAITNLWFDMLESNRATRPR